MCQGVTQYLTEEQLYDFMLEAHTDKCKKFKKWITHEVLPKIRKTGTYSTKQMSPMELLKLQYQVLEEHDKKLKEKYKINKRGVLYEKIIKFNTNRYYSSWYGWM